MPLRMRSNAIFCPLAVGFTVVLALVSVDRSLFAAPQASPAAAVEGLSRDLARAAGRKEWDAAVAVARQLAAARPGSAPDAYNLACMLARAGKGEEAVAALMQSAELGFAFTSTLLRDEDLDPVREHAGYASALDRIRGNNSAELEVAKPRLAKAPLLTFAPKTTPQRTATGPLPLIVALHGYGGTPEPIAELYRASASRLGAILVVPRGQETVGRGFGWGIVEQAEYLVLQAIDRAAAERPVGPVVLTGFSQGAGVALTMARRYPGKFAGVVAVAGWFEERLAPVPLRVLTPFPRFAFLNGELDEAAANNRRSAKQLDKAGAAVRVRIYPGLGHEFPPVEERDRELEQALRFALGI
ncbi:MAG: alpha/beta hydrolase-fold protein [Thermoanaerobaculia bacterium]